MTLVDDRVERVDATRADALRPVGRARAARDPSHTSCVAVFTTADLTCAASQPGWAARTRAAMPATCGRRHRRAGQGRAARCRCRTRRRGCRVPGAATSGLPWPSEPCTPRDEPELSMSPAMSSTTVPASAGPMWTVSVPAWISGSSASVVARGHLEAGDGGVAGDAGRERGLLGGQQHADRTGGRRVVEPDGRAAAAGGVVVVPPEVGDLAGDGGGLGGGERGAAVEVAARVRRRAR